MLTKILSKVILLHGLCVQLSYIVAIMKKASTWGGKRDGSGRRKKELTSTITLRVPAMYKPELTSDLKQYVVKWIAAKKIEEVGRVIQLVKKEL